jgi:hypothetical protein
MIDCEIYLAMNEDGGWIVTNDEGDALTQLSENEGGYLARVVKVTVKMTPPKMTEATVTVGADAGKVAALAD